MNRNQTDKRMTGMGQRKWLLLAYDAALLVLSNLLFIGVYRTDLTKTALLAIIFQAIVSFICVFGSRAIAGIYKQVWRFAGSISYLRLIFADVIASGAFVLLQLLKWPLRISCQQAFAVVAINLLMTLLIRHMYQYVYENASQRSRFGRVMRKIAEFMLHMTIQSDSETNTAVGKKINIAIIGAGRIGAMLADELRKNPKSSYEPCCFVDIDKSKIGREIMGIPVLSQDEATVERLNAYPVQEIVFALPNMSAERKRELYAKYQKTGCKLKVYDYPMRQADGSGKRQLREFDVEELLFRKPLNFTDEQTSAFYRNKCVLISGGGGSIGSELCRQIAKMQPKQIVILDVYENSAYDLQQKMRIKYGDLLNLHVEIASVCDRSALEQIFERYHPQVVLHAAAHKHVPFMEDNCCEAVKNNVFGTLNMVETAEKFGVEKFMMVSTDKAVNPTNVMGATKRMCEMIVQSRKSATKFSATRFGNVLGSNGSVIPLFKDQIRNGGPITITDKRIIRYFMTIPEASQLVLQSGARAKNGELYVLDMGKPVKILDLAENMVRLSGYEPYVDIQIIETGLRPGEKLYEELLIKNEELDKTENKMIFIERDKPLSLDTIKEKLDVLREAVMSNDDNVVRKALMKVVPTYHDPKEVNAVAIAAEEMKMVEKAG